MYKYTTPRTRREERVQSTTVEEDLTSNLQFALLAKLPLDVTPSTSALQNAMSSNEAKAASTQQGDRALVRQSQLLRQSSIRLGSHEETFAEAYSYDSSHFMNNFLRYGQEKTYAKGYFSPEANIPLDSLSRVEQFVGIVNRLPATGNVTLYRGGCGARGTSGEAFRIGPVKVGDILCNTDFASFTENPHTAKEFSSSVIGVEHHFDSTSVIFVLEHHKSAKIFAPLSIRSKAPYSEAESLVAPGKFFKIMSITENNVTLSGKYQKYMEILLNEVDQIKPVVSTETLSSALEFPPEVYDLRTGERIDVEVWSSRLGAAADQSIAWS
ncbi:hypothetical protein [Pseudomonas sp. NPDC086251]|uniref:hypothetical protein n=1 Tax=Pseudomonas sp. NPDC086251 TaxID=3364431 RepID=UPI0038346007